MSEVHTWSGTAASNDSSPPDGAPEGMAPSTVNDVIREVMAAMRRKDADENGTLTTAGGTTAYTVAAPNRTIASLAAGLKLRLQFNAVNADSPTLNVNSLGAVALRMPGGAPVGPRYFSTAGIYEVVYGSPNSTEGWYVQSVVGDAPRRQLALQASASLTLEAGRSYVCTYSGTSALTLPALSGVRVGDEVEVMAGNQAFTITPGSGEAIMWMDTATQTSNPSTRTFGGSGATATQRAARFRKLDDTTWAGFPYGYL